MFGFVKVGCITPNLLVGNPKFNVNEMLSLLDNCRASIAVFPELGITGYTCNDLFFQDSLLNDANNAVSYFIKNNNFEGICIIGAPIDVMGALYNCAIIIKKDTILGVVPKQYLPNSKEFYEKRWFKSYNGVNITNINYLGYEVPFGSLIFEDKNLNVRFGVEICEDMWAPIAPGNILSVNGANMIINLSASNETLGKSQIRRHAVLDHSRRNAGAYVYASAGVNESTSETVFSGHNIIASMGQLLKETENFSIDSEIIYADIDFDYINYQRRENTSLRDSLNFGIKPQIIEFSIQDNDFEFENKIDNEPYIPKQDVYESFNRIAQLQEFALFKRLKHIGSKKVLIGISGGLDSTLALLIAHQAFLKLNWDTKGIIAVTMPGLATSSRTKNNATKMMEYLGVSMMSIPINDSVNEHFKMIGHDPNVKDLTYENTQARMRTMILMDLATKYQGFVLGTGDMSELALGWCTYNGDQMSMYGINAGIPKTLVRFMVKNYAINKYEEIKDVLLDVVNTPISPELADSNQKTEDFIGKYEINDFIMYRFLECGDSEEKLAFMVEKAFNIKNDAATVAVKNFLHRFYQQQFKRQALPDGPKILSTALSPRGDWRMPSDIKR